MLRSRLSGAIPPLLSMFLWRGQIKIVTLTEVDVVPLSAILGDPYFRKLPSTGEDLKYNACYLYRCTVHSVAYLSNTPTNASI